jgi:hypothetical protein
MYITIALTVKEINSIQRLMDAKSLHSSDWAALESARKAMWREYYQAVKKNQRSGEAVQGPLHNEEPKIS